MSKQLLQNNCLLTLKYSILRYKLCSSIGILECTQLLNCINYNLGF